MSKKLQAFIAKAKDNDAYWIEQAKVDFSVALNDMRKAADISFAELARKLGTSASYITKVFRGDSNLTIESMVKLSRAVGGTLRVTISDVSQSASHPWIASSATQWGKPIPSCRSTIFSVSSITSAQNDSKHEAAA